MWVTVGRDWNRKGGGFPPLFLGIILVWRITRLLFFLFFFFSRPRGGGGGGGGE